MTEHKDVAGRQQWNAFKKDYRKSNPTKIRNTQYYQHLRQLYHDRNAPTLEPWLEMSSSQNNAVAARRICWAQYGSMSQSMRAELLDDCLKKDLEHARLVKITKIAKHDPNALQNMKAYIAYLSQDPTCSEKVLTYVREQIRILEQA